MPDIMSMITLFSAFMGLYVIIRLILPSGMNWPLKFVLSLFAFACAEKICSYVLTEKGFHAGDNELLYLTIHIARVMKDN